MTSFDYRLNPIYAIKECSTCGVLYTADFCCSKKGLEDKILVPKPPRNCARCARCGTPVDGPYCQGCALLRKEFMEGLFTNCVENEFFKDFQDTSESSDDNTNVVNAPREPIVVNQDPGENSSPSPPHIDHCCHECGDSLDGIFCRQCTCKSCGKGAHYGYNCPPRVPIISNPEPCKNQTIGEHLQNLQRLQQQCLLGTCQRCGCNEYDGVCFYCKVGNGTPINVSTPYSSNDSPSVANHPPQPQYVPYSCEIRGNDSHYGYDCPPQVPFVYEQDLCFNQNFDYFPQTSPSFPQQYLCCENCGGPHETFQCQPMNEDYYHEQNSCYDSNSFGFDQVQPPQYTVNHPIFNSQNELLNSQNKLMEQMTTLRDLVDQVIQKKEEEKRIAEEQAAKDRSWKIPICYDDDEDNTIAITPVLPIEEPDNSLSMGDEHLDTIPATESDEGVVEIVESDVRRIDDDILLTIKTISFVKICSLNVNLLIAKIDSLRDNPTPSSEVVIKSSSTSPNLFLEEINTFDNSSPEAETFCFDLEEISSGKKSSGSTITHVDFSQYDSFIFDLSNDQFPPPDRSDFNHEEFADELTHIMPLPELECFKFKIEPDPGDLTSIDPGIRKNVSTTNVNVPLEDDQSSLFAYVVWIFLAFLTISRIVKTLIHMSFTSSASFWESRTDNEEKTINEAQKTNRIGMEKQGKRQ
ncbi:hypothetical protein Tco_1517367, partial [Tanacetum coccineum]